MFKNSFLTERGSFRRVGPGNGLSRGDSPTAITAAFKTKEGVTCQKMCEGRHSCRNLIKAPPSLLPSLLRLNISLPPGCVRLHTHKGSQSAFLNPGLRKFKYLHFPQEAVLNTPRFNSAEGKLSEYHDVSHNKHKEGFKCHEMCTTCTTCGLQILRIIFTLRDCVL